MTDTQYTLDISIFTLTKVNIINAIISAHRRGVHVRVITDKEKSKNEWVFPQLNKLIVAGIPVKIKNNYGLMHLKITISDNRITCMGSYNYTIAATKDNDDLLVIITSLNVCTDFKKEFDEMWASSNYINYIPADII
ncbi:MAG: phospholipase D-like domain-containing protein [Clostridium sp.]